VYAGSSVKMYNAALSHLSSCLSKHLLTPLLVFFLPGTHNFKETGQSEHQVSQIFFSQIIFRTL